MYSAELQRTKWIAWNLCLPFLSSSYSSNPTKLCLLNLFRIPIALADGVVGIFGTILGALRTKPLAAVIGTALEPPGDVFTLIQHAQSVAACLGGLPLLGRLVIAISTGRSPTPLLLALFLFLRRGGLLLFAVRE